MIEEIKKKALEEKVPIIKDEGLFFLLEQVKVNNAKEILELGTAVGYSSIQMAKLSKDIHIDTIERNKDMYEKAIKNIKDEGLDNQIDVHFKEIKDFKTTTMYDLIFVDAAKSKYGDYLEQFIDNLKDDGVMVFDNMIFHSMIYDVESIKNRNTRSLVKKIVKFREKVHNDSRFDIIFNDLIGDGILLLRKKGAR